MADIRASDVNAIRQKIVDTLGTGSGSYGYGQTIYSGSVTSGQRIEKSQWDAIRYDIVNVFIHQTGNTPSVVNVVPNDVIRDDPGYALHNYNYYADIGQNNRFDIATGQFSLLGDGDAARLAGVDVSTSSTWNSSAEATLTVTFSNSEDARHFFNAGGKIRIATSLTGGTSSQAGAWTTLLSTVGDQDFKGDIVVDNGFYTLTNSYKTYYSRAASTPYSSNTYELKAKCNVADNSSGTATVIDIKVELTDAYVDPGAPAPGDLVDGTLSIVVQELLPGGTLQPTGDPFVIAPPASYSMSAISVS